MKESFYRFRRRPLQKEERLVFVRSEGGRDYYIDQADPLRREFFVHRRALEHTVATLEPTPQQKIIETTVMVDGMPVKLTIYPPYVPNVRSVANAGAGQSLGDGGYKKGGSAGSS